MPDATKIVLVEDDPDFIYLIRQVVDQCGALSFLAAARRGEEGIKARRGHKKAIIAICRMLLTAIWNILSMMTPYSPDGFFSPRPVVTPKILTMSQAFALLRLRGYVVKDDPASPAPA